MSLRYSYQPHSAHQRPLCARPLQEPQEEAEEAEEAVEAAEAVEAVEAVEAEEEEEDKQTPLISDSAETLPKYSREKEKRQIASSPNSNAII